MIKNQLNPTYSTTDSENGLRHTSNIFQFPQIVSWEQVNLRYAIDVGSTQESVMKEKQVTCKSMMQQFGTGTHV